MIHRQDGITALGFLILAAFLGLFALAAIKLIPVYLENAKIQSTLEKVKEEHDGNRPTVNDIRAAIGRRFNIESVNALQPNDVQIKRISGGYSVDASYDARVSYLGNLYLVAEFSNQIEVMN